MKYVLIFVIAFYIGRLIFQVGIHLVNKLSTKKLKQEYYRPSIRSSRKHLYLPPSPTPGGRYKYGFGDKVELRLIPGSSSKYYNQLGVVVDRSWSRIGAMYLVYWKSEYPFIESLEPEHGLKEYIP